MKKILFTGASGFIGSAFINRFFSLPDVQFCAVGRRESPNIPSSVLYRSIDLSKPFNLDFEPDIVIHAAGRTSPWGTNEQYQQQNVDTLRQVIAFCEQKSHPRLVYLSTSAVFYRNEHQFGLTEDSSIGPDFINQYAASKYAGEQLLNDYRGEKVILRPRAVFGPGDTLLFPRLLEAAQKGQIPYLISKDKKAIGDLIYIDVLCDYIFKAATLPNVASAYNLTNAEPVELEGFLIEMLQAFGLPLPQKQYKISTAMRLAGMIEGLYRMLHISAEPPITKFGISVFAYSKTFDPTRTLSDFGAPSMTLRQGLAEFVKWHQRQ